MRLLQNAHKFCNGKTQWWILRYLRKDVSINLFLFFPSPDLCIRKQKVSVMNETTNTMKIIAQILALGNFQSSSSKTPQFLKFAKHFKIALKRELATIGASDVSFNVGHFYISGFFVTKDGGTYYFSIPDVRGAVTQMMYRTARDKKDYTGGSNQYVQIGEGMAKKMTLADWELR